RATGVPAEFNAIDRDGYTFDDRDGGKMPVFNPGFDVANPQSWSLVKGLSTIRYFTNTVENEFRVARVNFTYEALPEMALKFGMDCNCVNKWGDYRAIVDGRQRAAVTEQDVSGFFQVDYNVNLLGRPLRGNVGMRIANTRVSGSGNVGGSDGVAGVPVTANNE